MSEPDQTRDRKIYPLRLPADVRAAAEQAARDEGRSLNTYIIRAVKAANESQRIA